MIFEVIQQRKISEETEAIEVAALQKRKRNGPNKENQDISKGKAPEVSVTVAV